MSEENNNQNEGKKIENHIIEITKLVDGADTSNIFEIAMKAVSLMATISETGEPDPSSLDSEYIVENVPSHILLDALFLYLHVKINELAESLG